MYEHNILFAAVARDCAAGIQRLRPKIERVLDKFNNSDIYIYENDSRDNTKEVLIEWQQNSFSNKVILKLENLNLPKLSDLSAARIQNMARYRNNYVDYLNQNYGKYDFLMVMDLDLCDFDENGVLDSIDLLNDDFNDLAALTANGRISRSHFTNPENNVYYDAFAHADSNESLDGRTNLQKRFYEIQKKYSDPNYLKSARIFYVNSGFGGLAIYRNYYRINELLGFPYYSQINGYAEHAGLHKNIYKLLPNKYIAMNPKMVTYYD